MSGQQHLHRLQSGKNLLKLTMLILTICTTSLGCTKQITSMIPGPGRYLTGKFSFAKNIILLGKIAVLKRYVKLLNFPEFILMFFHIFMSQNTM